MESLNVKKLKKAVVSLQKLDLPNQRSCQEMSTESCESEDVSSEITAVDSIESNVGCTDDDDLEKKIQAFSIPVKKDGETLISSALVAVQTLKAKDSTNTSNEKSKCVKAKPTSLVTKVSKTKSEDTSHQNKTLTGKEKVSDDKSSVEKVKPLSSKTTVEKVHEKTFGKSSAEKISKNEIKSTSKKHTSDTSHNKPRKRKQSVDGKSEENDSSIKPNPNKSQKQDRQTPITQSSSKINITTTQTKKLNTSHRSNSDKSTLDCRGEARKSKLHSNSDSKKSDKEKTNESTSKEERKRKFSDSESAKAKTVMKHEKSVSKIKVCDGKGKSKHKNSELSETNISLKKHSLQGPSITKSITKSIKADKPPQTTHTVSKESIKKKEADENNTPKSRNSTVQNKRKLKESGEEIVIGNKKDRGKKPVLTSSGLSKHNKRNEDDKIFRKAKLGKVRSHRGLMDLKLKQPKPHTSQNSKFDRSHLHRNKSFVNKKQHEKHKSEEKVTQANGKTRNIEKQGSNRKKKKIVKSSQHSLGKSNENSGCIFEKKNVKLTQDNKHEDSIFKGKFLLVKSVFKTVSKKSDVLPSQNIGTESYKKLWKWSHYIRMPSSMWSLHKHPQGDYVIILHISEISSFPKIIIDKYVQFKENAVPLVKLYDKEVPSLGTTEELRTLGEVCSFLKQIDSVSVCENFKNLSVEESNSNCEIFINKVVALPFTCKNCSSCTVKTT